MPERRRPAVAFAVSVVLVLVGDLAVWQYLSKLPADDVPPVDAAPPEPRKLSLDRLLKPPEPLRDPLASPLPRGRAAEPTPNPASNPRDGSRIRPSVHVESERHEGPSPNSDVKTRKVGAGFRVPANNGASVSVEGAVRQEVPRKETSDPAPRDNSIGLRIEVPWPDEKARK